MVTFIINGKKKRLPSCLEELTVRQAQRIITEWTDQQDYLTLFSIFCDVQKYEIKELKDFKLYKEIGRAIDFIYKDGLRFEEYGMPKVLEIKGKTIEVPKDIKELTMEQAIHIRKRTESEKIGNLIAFASAVYLQPYYSKQGKFDLKKANELEQVILNLPAVDYYNLGFFLSVKYSHYGETFITAWLRINQILMVNVRRLKRWLTLSD